MRDTEIFKRKNGQLLCDHNMDYKLDPAFIKGVAYMESRVRLGLRISVPFMVSADTYDNSIDTHDMTDRETGIDGNLIVNDI